jgi:DNA helicase-2/ATP-dependent DNA helicase PcrA
MTSQPEESIVFKPRPKQREVLRYRRGKMGVSAVPGSGKTQTLSYLAASLIARGMIADDQEVLIVTLVNSAVDNFAHRIAKFMEAKQLLPHLGYRVRTLHGLAHDIVRERPSLVGLAEDFQIIDDRLSEQILEEAALVWLRNNPQTLDSYIDPLLDEDRQNWVRRDQLPDMVNALAGNFIRYAKDLQISPDALSQKLESLPVPLPLAQMGCDIYTDYERALAYRGAVDFDDLIRLALQALQTDEKLLDRLRYQWPYILEDEAQDSSRLQEVILTLLAGPKGNWVRVGDPNQAIYETFTTASPEYLRSFLRRTDVKDRELPNSGRSTFSIMDLANTLIDWTQAAHPLEAARTALDLPHIQPTPRGDPQPNPPDDPGKIRLIAKKYSPEEEVQVVSDSIERWLPEHPDETVAVLVPRNGRGYELTEALKKRNIIPVEMLGSTNATRMASGALANVLQYLADPQSASKLSTAYRVWRRKAREEEGSADQADGSLENDGSVQQEEPETVNPPENIRPVKSRIEKVAALIRKCTQVEDYLWPHAGRDWLADLGLTDENADLVEELAQFRELVQRWHGTALLPIDQVALTLAQDLFTSPTDLAITHKLAILLRRAGEEHPDWRLPEMTEEIAVIARNERRFLGFSDDDTGFDPDKYKGKVVVSTIHKAKGLEWDRIYLMSVNNYDFPSGAGYDRYISEKWFLRDGLNLEAEALAQLDAAFSTDEYSFYEEGAATQKARLEYISERIRLLYVGITRARKELVITWNTGRDGKQQPAIPLVALQTFWEERMQGR